MIYTSIFNHEDFYGMVKETFPYYKIDIGGKYIDNGILITKR